MGLRLFLEDLSLLIFFFSSRRRHTRCLSDWSSDVVLFRSKDHHPYEAAAWTTRPAGVGAQGEHEEEPAEHILALSDPNHAFGAEGMKRKKCCHERATPEQIGRASCREREQNTGVDGAREMK